MLGDEYVDEKSWPYCGEIDILESVGREFDADGKNGINHASCHTRAYYFKQGNQISSTIPVPNMATEFHNYAVEWSPEGIKAFLDGKHYYTYDKLDGPLEWPFDKPQNLILNLANGSVSLTIGLPGRLNHVQCALGLWSGWLCGCYSLLD